MSASVATRNPFALLGDDGSRPASPAPPPKQAAPTPAVPTRGTAKPARGASRGGKYYQRGGARPGAGNPNQNGIDEAPGEGIRKETPRGRGGKRGGGRGGQSGGRGGRPFDKHSQTGRVDSEKKIHQSWGGDDGNAERQTEEAATRDAAADASGDWGADASGGADAWAGTAETPAVDDAAKAADDAAKEERRQRREREQEEEDSTLTLDQYLAQQKEKDNAVVPKLEARQVDSEWTDVVPLQKSEDSSYYAGKEKSAPKARAKKEEKVYLDIDARFDRPQRGGPRGRGGPREGGREGGERRGRGGRGGGRGGRPNTNQSQVNVDDETAFPSLS